MAVVNLIAALEDHFGIRVEDDEISASTFATLGSLAAFVQEKLPRMTHRPTRAGRTVLPSTAEEDSAFACTTRPPAHAAARCCTCIRLPKK